MKKKIVIFTGAGVSKESGVDTFRDTGGLWEGHKVEDVATLDGWKRDRETVLDFYNKKRRQLEKVLPNAAHEHIAAFDKDEDYHAVVITQNVDNLHERAGSENVVHLHGELTKARGCMYDHKSSMFDTIVDVGYRDINIGDKCEVTGSQLRPHVVWFGESVPAWSDAAATIKDADALIVVGTSLNVYPAATVFELFGTEKPAVYVDPSATYDNMKESARLGLTMIAEPATVGVPKAIELIKEQLA